MSDILPSAYDAMPLAVRDAWDWARAEDARPDSLIGYKHDRTLLEYITTLGGMSMFLRHAAAASGSDVVFDIGAGDAVAINDLADLRCASQSAVLVEGLRFAATGLSAPAAGAHNRLPYYLTGAETLTDVPQAAGMLAVYSIMYSQRPDMVVEAVTRHLVPGGVLKATFPRTPHEHVAQADAPTYRGLLQDAGYDVALGRSWSGARVLAAVCPGGSPLYEANEIVRRDAYHLPEMEAAYQDLEVVRLLECRERSIDAAETCFFAEDM